MGKLIYYRRITETLPQPLRKGLKAFNKYIILAMKRENLAYHLTHFSIMFMVILFIFLVYYVVLGYLAFIEARDEYNRALSNLTYWEEIVGKHPNFPDGYYNAAVYAAMLGQREKSITFLDRALVLDPDFKEAMELERQLTHSTR